ALRGAARHRRRSRRGDRGGRGVPRVGARLDVRGHGAGSRAGRGRVRAGLRPARDRRHDWPGAPRAGGGWGVGSPGVAPRGLAWVGVAFALVCGPLAIAATTGVGDAEQGVAGGVLNTGFQLGAALGISAATAVSVLALGDATGPEAGLRAFHTALWVPVAAF